MQVTLIKHITWTNIMAINDEANAILVETHLYQASWAIRLWYT